MSPLIEEMKTGRGSCVERGQRYFRDWKSRLSWRNNLESFVGIRIGVNATNARAFMCKFLVIMRDIMYHNCILPTAIIDAMRIIWIWVQVSMNHASTLPSKSKGQSRGKLKQHYGESHSICLQRGSHPKNRKSRETRLAEPNNRQDFTFGPSHKPDLLTGLPKDIGECFFC